MPELPEVETVRRGLSKLVTGEKIVALKASYPRMVLTGFDALKSALLGQTIRQVSRRGKYLIFEFDELALISHLRMEGKYRLETADFVVQKHDHIFMTFADGKTLIYNDVRKFGTWELIGTEKNLTELSKKLEQYFVKKNLGPEPTFTDFDLSIFRKKLQKSRKKIKPYLLEQTLVVGLGNIYVDEVLWAAQIHPETMAMALTEEQIKLLHDTIIEILQLAVVRGGSSIRTYTNAFGKEGDMQNELKVYGKEGTACPRCGTIIEKIKVAGRGTHFCPNCQKKIF
ncbi:DNA-formamidopyrimidine glycosylase [Lactococcus nasutitermitis]|uniref:Formamidopyrimidine-DNA glycosylase n=1 Tax=Lactococcus nasutitermitis TaxID=1652957 RepID=A0ABV9JHE8_9LACT|nr:DNA-formamidopyrimidine glycosylase [Lactococcus nasutitermitis]